MNTPTTATTRSRASVVAARSTAFNVLVGLTTLVVFLQAVWAGMIIREGKAYNDTWVNVHDIGARVAFFLALAATIMAVIKLRSRRDLLIGSIALTVTIFLESYVGGIIGDRAGAIAVHIPLGFAIMALAVWLPLRSGRASATASPLS